MSGLSNLYLPSCDLTSLDVDKPYDIFQINASENPLTSIDLSSQLELRNLNLQLE